MWVRPPQPASPDAGAAVSSRRSGAVWRGLPPRRLHAGLAPGPRRGWHQADPSGASRVPSSPPPAGPWTAHSGRVTLDVGASVCPVALRVRLRCPRRGGSRASAPASRAPPWACRPSRPLGPEAEPPGGWPPSVGASARGDGFAEASPAHGLSARTRAQPPLFKARGPPRRCSLPCGRCHRGDSPPGVSAGRAGWPVSASRAPQACALRAGGSPGRQTPPRSAGTSLSERF